MVFWERLLEFSEISKDGNFSLECLWNGIILLVFFFFHLVWGFAKSQETSKFRKIRKIGFRVPFLSFYLACFHPLTKLESGKHPGGCPESCYNDARSFCRGFSSYVDYVLIRDEVGELCVTRPKAGGHPKTYVVREDLQITQHDPLKNFRIFFSINSVQN